MNNPDQDTLIRAVEDARRILGEYIEPGPRDARRTVERLPAVLDRDDVVHALVEFGNEFQSRFIVSSGGGDARPTARDLPQRER